MTETLISKKPNGNTVYSIDIPFRLVGGIALLLILPLCVMAQAQAQANENSVEQSILTDFNLRLSGFGTLGVVKNSSDELYFHREFSMKASSSEYSFKTDSLLGLQLNGDVTERLEGVAQVVIKDRASVDALDSIELLFLRYRPSRGWAIRAGRTSTDLYMLSEYRNVSYAYLWSRPIPEFYAITSSVAKIDGLDISYILSLEEGSWETKLAYGITHSSLISQAGLVELDFNHALALTSIYTENDWTMRLAVVSIEVDEIEFLTNELVEGLNLVPDTLWPEAGKLAQSIDGPGKKLAYYALGFQYDHMNWGIQSELGYIDSEWGIFQSLYNGYLSVGYRVDEITYYGVLASIDNAEEPDEYVSPQLPDQLPQELKAGIAALYEGGVAALSVSQFEQTTFSLGLRWDLYPDACIKLQWDHTWIDQGGMAMWTQAQQQVGDAEVDLLSLNINFIFSL